MTAAVDEAAAATYVLPAGPAVTEQLLPDELEQQLLELEPRVGDKTPLGLPYPAPTDPLADAAAHVKALSDAVSLLLAKPGRNWGQDAVTANQYGGIWVYTGGLASVQGYNMGASFRGGTVGANGYFYIFVLGGTWNTTGITCTVFPSEGTGTGIPNVLVEYSFTGFGAPG